MELGILSLAAVAILLSSWTVATHGFDVQFVTWAFWTTMLLAFLGVLLRRCRERLAARVLGWLRIVSTLIASLGFASFCVGTYQHHQRQSNIWWQSPERIRTYLFTQTAHGTSEGEVLGWLKGRGVAVALNRHHLEPNIEYPPTTTGGEAWTQVVLDVHGFPFETYIEVFYVFDAEGRLVDISVRPSVNAL